MFAVNDPFVMKVWAKPFPENKHVKFLADGSASYTRALGLEMDLGDKGLGTRLVFLYIVCIERCWSGDGCLCAVCVLKRRRIEKEGKDLPQCVEAKVKKGDEEEESVCIYVLKRSSLCVKLDWD
ncbi:hypothetical protein QQ045_016957 [Rhodiola kirilowii]